MDLDPSHRTLGHRAPLLWLVLPYMGGLATGRMGLAPPLPVALAAAFLLAASAAIAYAALPAGGGTGALGIDDIGAADIRAVRRPTGCRRIVKHPQCATFALVAAMILAGNASYALHRARPLPWNGRRFQFAHLSLRIIHPYPQASPKKAGGLAIVTAGRAPLGILGQRLYYSGALRPGQTAPERSAIVDASGLLAAVPSGAPADSFYGSLSSQGVAVMLVRAHIGGERRPASAYYRFCARLSRRMRARLGTGLERRPDLAAMYGAMMLGWKSSLSPAQKKLFMHSGAMHLFAINGVHIGMVALALHALLALARCPRAAAGAVVLAVLWLDVDTTGASPSAVRAFTMLAFLEAGHVFRRPANPLAALAASALVSLLADPLGFFSASFQMSYSVVAALLTLGLPLAAALDGRFSAWQYLPEVSWRLWHRVLAWIARKALQGAGIGIAAALVGAVTGVEFFGLFTPAGIAANLVLVPLASLVIIAGCLALAIPHGGPAAAILFNHAAGVLLAAIEGLMALSSRVPGAWIPAHFRAAWIGPAALSALLGTLIGGYSAGWSRRRGAWLPPFAVVAAALAFGVKW